MKSKFYFLKKAIVFLTILILTAIKLYSQVTFEKGYFIDEGNQRIDCFIKNIDWEDNPTEFEYKLSENTEIRNATIQTAKEFGIDGVSKYLKARVNLDRSTDDLRHISLTRSPVFQEELLFLKVLIEGKASLFFYKDGDIKRFFYIVDNSEINQLIYKRYKTSENKVAQNFTFREQLLQTLKCEEIAMNDVELLNYDARNLERLFVNYNKCINPAYINFIAKEKKDLFNFTVRPGLNIGSLSVQNSSAVERGTDFDTEIGLRVGVEAEFILPFNKDKWAILIEPTYQYFNSEKTKETSNVSGGILVAKIDYKSIELPIGLRHSFLLKNKSKFFLNVSYLLDFALNSKIKFTRSDGSLMSSTDVRPRSNIALGIGYKHKNRFSLEMRYQTNREIFGGFPDWNSSYKSTLIILGYSF